MRFVLLLLLLIMPTASSGQTLHNRATDGLGHGWFTSSAIGAAWTDITAASFASLNTETIPATARFVTITVRNRHATQTLFVLFRAGGATATADAFRLLAGESYTFTVHGAEHGVGPSTMSLQGSGAATEADVAALFVPSP